MRTLVRVLAGPSEVMVSRLVSPASGVAVVTATLASGDTESSAVLMRSRNRSRMLARDAALISAVVHGAEVDRHERRAVYADLEPGARSAGRRVDKPVEDVANARHRAEWPARLREAVEAVGRVGQVVGAAGRGVGVERKVDQGRALADEGRRKAGGGRVHAEPGEGLVLHREPAFLQDHTQIERLVRIGGVVVDLHPDRVGPTASRLGGGDQHVVAFQVAQGYGREVGIAGDADDVTVGAAVVEEQLDRFREVARRVGRAEVAIEVGDAEQARRAVDRALRARPRNAPIDVENSDDRAHAAWNLLDVHAGVADRHHGLVLFVAVGVPAAATAGRCRAHAPDHASARRGRISSDVGSMKAMRTPVVEVTGQWADRVDHHRQRAVVAHCSARTFDPSAGAGNMVVRCPSTHGTREHRGDLGVRCARAG